MNNGIFEGSFRRLPEQNLAGASKHSRKGDFLQQVHWERANRQLEIRKQQCAVKIQALVRGFLVRKRLRNLRESMLISSFTSAYEERLSLNQLGDHLVSYHCLNTLNCADILTWLSKQAMLEKLGIIRQFSVTDSPWLWRIRWFLRIHLKRINLLIDQPSSEHVQSLYTSLQALDVFTNYSLYNCVLGKKYASAALKTIFLYLVNNDYFGAAKRLLEVKDHSYLNFNDRLALTNHVQDLLNRPIKSLLFHDYNYMSAVIRELCCHFLTNKTTPDIKSLVIPMILSMDCCALLILINSVCDGSVAPTSSCLYVIVQLFDKGYSFYSPSIFCKMMTAFSVLLKISSKQCADNNKIVQDSFFCDEPILDSEAIDEDDDDDDSTIDDNDELQDDLNGEMVKECLNYLQGIDFALDVLSFIGTQYNMEILLHFSQFLHVVITEHLHEPFKILWYVSLHPTIYRDLWTVLYSMTRVLPDDKPVSLITLLCKGTYLTASEAAVFYPTLISFCLIFKRHLCMRYSEDTSDNSDLPFSIAKMTEISSKLRDVALALLNIGVPDAPISVSKEVLDCNLSYMKNSYKVMVDLLRVLHSREIGPDQSFWVSKKMLISPVLPVLNERSLLSKHIPFDEKTLKDRLTIPTNNIAKTFILLRDLPFSISAKDRLNLLHELFLFFKTQYQNPNEFIRENVFIKIRRDYIYEDAFEKLSSTEVPELRVNIRIQLTSAIGYEEVGVDGGGIFREFMGEFLRAAFDPNRGFFLLNKDRQLYPNPNVEVLYSNYKQHYYFIGRMLAKALYENILVDLPLADCFVSSLVKRDKDVNLSDLHSLDPELFKNLILLRSYEGDVTNLGLNYTTVSDLYGHTTVTELIPGGEKITVNKANKVDYIQTVADYKLNTQIEAQTSSFRQGIASVFSIFWLAIFSAKELQRLIFCSDSPIDVEDLKNNCCYTGGYSSSHPNIIRFWNVFQTFEDIERKQLVKFVTSCSRQPLLGFKDLDPPFTIQLVECSDRLPTSSTCMNLLKLPIFQDEKVMKEKLLYSIQAQAGFDLC